jgi:hypothetical protein
MRRVASIIALFLASGLAPDFITFYVFGRNLPDAVFP